MALAIESVSTHLARRLEGALRSWWEAEQGDWDAAVTGTDPESLPGGAELWNQMPLVDSKTAARSSAVFKEILGLRLKMKLIRPGGYHSIEDMITDLVPKMMEVLPSKRKDQQ